MGSRTFTVVLICVVCMYGMITPSQGEVQTYSVLVVDPPITNQAIMPGWPLPKVCKQVDVIQLKSWWWRNSRWNRFGSRSMR